MRQAMRISRLVLPVLLLLVLASATAGAHCDTMNGPVVKAAQTALERGDVRLVMIWVKPEAEPEIRSLFERVRAARTQGEPARSVADRLFFETVVRLHRAGEGAPFTGLKDASEPLEPGVVEAEASISAHSPKALSAELTALLHRGIEESFRELEAARNYPPEDVAAGRRYVGAYVRYIHSVERLYKTLATHGEGEEHPVEPHNH
jgi:hypothetical protein